MTKGKALLELLIAGLVLYIKSDPKVRNYMAVEELPDT